MMPFRVVLPILLAASHAGAAPPPGYAGSARCGSCHKRQYELWSKDWHRRALAPASPESVVAPFDPPFRIEKGATRAETVRDRDRFAMNAAGRDGAMRTWPVAFSIGGRRMQDFLTPFAGGRLQVLPIYWHATGSGEWVDYTTVKQGDLDPEHPFFWTNYARTFNKECVSCHVTGGSIGWNETRETFETRWAEPGVACEDCHGPGSRHARNGTRETIVRPTGLSPDRAEAICAACHSPRAPWRSAFSKEARFRPGQRLDDVFEPLTPVMGPGELSGDFWIDGRPSVGSMESAALEQSACARRGGMTCFTCHTAPHGGGGLSELKPKARTNAVCLECHRKLEEAGARSAHTFHAEGAPGSSCVDCHMPKTLLGVLDPQADHSLDVPHPRNHREHGIPDACTACHSEKGVEWAIAELERRFPASPALGERRLRLAKAMALWRDASPEAEPRLAEILEDRDEIALMRANAATALGSTRSASLLGSGALRRALLDPSAVIAARAARSLGARRDEESAEDLARAAASGRDAVALPAALALLDLGDARGLSSVVALLARPGLAGDYRLETALGILDERRHDLAGAVNHFRRAISDRPDFLPARDRLARVLDLLGKRNQAAKQRRLAKGFQRAVSSGHGG